MAGQEAGASIILLLGKNNIVTPQVHMLKKWHARMNLPVCSI